jgi:hypothetical protein
MTTTFEHDPAMDLVLVRDGVVVQVARAPCEPSWFGDTSAGELLDMEAGGCGGRHALGRFHAHHARAAPRLTPPPPPVDRHAELVAAGFTSEQADAILAIVN